MKAFSHLWQYLTKFFLEWEIFLTRVVHKIENRDVYELVSKNMVKPEVPQITSQYGAYAFNAG